ncbi:MAG: XRE family transcriptional regulator [Xanthomonadales bacterium]|nr:XRE family transcriptional regulator [Xanthomonadales bacterium]
MDTEAFENVWDAIAREPEQAENMRMRSALMRALRDRIQAQGWTQSEAARRLGVSQPRISDLMRGKLSRFSLDGLVRLAAAAGLRINLSAEDAA